MSRGDRRELRSVSEDGKPSQISQSLPIAPKTPEYSVLALYAAGCIAVPCVTSTPIRCEVLHVQQTKAHCLPSLRQGSRRSWRETTFTLNCCSVSRSEAKNWDAAKQEWELDSIYFADSATPGKCLCGHAPIIELCVIRNRKNGKVAVVGNVCVTRFIGLPAGRLFQDLQRIRRNPASALNADTIRDARRRGWITEWEEKFSLDTCRWNCLTRRQRETRVKINEKILRRVVSSESLTTAGS